MGATKSNFDGDWSDRCTFCGRSHLEHQQKHPLPDGVIYLHRMPCEQERHAIRKKLVWRGILLRTVLFICNVGRYIWDKVPFKEEARLVWQFVKHVFVSLRALVLLMARRPK